MTDADPRTTEELEKEKIVLEIEKLRQDMDLSRRKFDADMKREGRNMIIAAVGGAATFLAAAVAFGKLFFGG
jgi:hypothetical protein